MADLEADPLVMFQHHHYNVFFLVFAIIFPTIIPSILWGESVITSYFVTGRIIQHKVKSL